MRSGRAVWAVAMASATMAILAACAGPSPAVTPGPSAAATATLGPTPTFRPAVAPTSTVLPFGIPSGASQAQVQATVDPSAVDPVDVEDAFLNSVDEVTGQASDLSDSTCEDLTAATRQSPTMVGSMRGFAATLKRTAASQPVLDTDAVKAALADMDQAMGELDGALSLCGISAQP